MRPQKLISIFSILFCLCLALSVCQSEKNTVKQIEADRVVAVISHKIEDGVYDAEATITDEETVAQIVRMHNTVRIRGLSRPLAQDRFALTFYLGEDMITTWWLARWDDGTIISSSDTFGIGNYVVTNDFDYDRLVEILNSSVQ